MNQAAKNVFMDIWEEIDQGQIFGNYFDDYIVVNIHLICQMTLPFHQTKIQRK